MKTMNTETQLATREQEPSVALMLQGALAGIQSSQITPSHVEVLERMMSLYERDEKRRAETAFADALVALQGETIRVQATKKVDEKQDGSCRYKFAPYEEIMEQVQPMLTKHGFAITFDTDGGDPQRLTSICTLTHRGGHSKQNRFAVRYGKPPGSSDAQGDMSTKSYAKRGALCDCLNISIEHDTDGRDDPKIEGRPVSQKQADDLRDWVDAVGGDRAKFLALARVATFEEIPESKLEMLEHELKRKERARR